MTPAETAGLTVADIVEYASALGSPVAALGIWFFGVVMLLQNRSKAAQADEDRKVTHGLLAALDRQGAALERQGAALERPINRTDAVVVELQRHQGPGTRPRRRA